MGAVVVDELDRWLTELSKSPMGAILVFLAVFLSRVMLDRWDRRRARRKTKDHRSRANG